MRRDGEKRRRRIKREERSKSSEKKVRENVYSQSS